ncbi:hypothetical protein AB0O00_31255, partial [Kitasatospora sp. NPDC093558]
GEALAGPLAGEPAHPVPAHPEQPHPGPAGAEPGAGAGAGSEPELEAERATAEVVPALVSFTLRALGGRDDSDA